MVTASSSWSEIAAPAGSTAATVAGFRARSPRVKNQSRRPWGGSGVPSGRVRWVAWAVLHAAQS